MASTSVPSTVVKNSRSGWHDELVAAHLDLGQVASRLEGLVTRLVGPAPGAATNTPQEEAQGAQAQGVFDQVARKARAIKGVNGRIAEALDRLEEMLPE